MGIDRQTCKIRDSNIELLSADKALPDPGLIQYAGSLHVINHARGKFPLIHRPHRQFISLEALRLSYFVQPFLCCIHFSISYLAYSLRQYENSIICLLGYTLAVWDPSNNGQHLEYDFTFDSAANLFLQRRINLGSMYVIVNQEQLNLNGLLTRETY